MGTCQSSQSSIGPSPSPPSSGVSSPAPASSVRTGPYRVSVDPHKDAEPQPLINNLIVAPESTQAEAQSTSPFHANSSLSPSGSAIPLDSLPQPRGAKDFLTSQSHTRTATEKPSQAAADDQANKVTVPDETATVSFNRNNLAIASVDGSLLSEPFSHSGAVSGNDSGSRTPLDGTNSDDGAATWNRARTLTASDLQKMLMKRQLSKNRVIDVDLIAGGHAAHTISGTLTTEYINSLGEKLNSHERRRTAGGEKGKMTELALSQKRRLKRDNSNFSSQNTSGASSPPGDSPQHQNANISMASSTGLAVSDNSDALELSRDQIRRRVMLRGHSSNEIDAASNNGSSPESSNSPNVSGSPVLTAASTPPAISPSPIVMPALTRIRSTGRFIKSKHSHRNHEAASTPASFTDEPYPTHSMDNSAVYGPGMSAPEPAKPSQSLSHSSTFHDSPPVAAAPSPTHSATAAPTRKAAARSPNVNPRRATFAPNNSGGGVFSSLADQIQDTAAPASASGALPSAALLRAASQQARGRGKRLALVVDSVQVSQQLNSVTLYRCGYQVSLAASGEKAVEMAMETHYDLILMEMMLPGMSGLDACRAIRANENARGDLPSLIIAFTAAVEAHSLAEYQQIRFNACLEKGCVLSEILPEAMAALARNPNFLFIDSKHHRTQATKIDADIDTRNIQFKAAEQFSHRTANNAGTKVAKKRPPPFLTLSASNSSSNLMAVSL